MLKMYKNLVRPEKNILTVTYNLFKELKVDVTQTSLKKSLEQHPHYPSLLSVSDVLSHYRVENFTAKLGLTKLKTLDQPFLALLKAEDSFVEYYCLIKSISDDGVLFLNSTTGRNNKSNWAEFEKIYQGVVLIAESSESSGDTNFTKEKSFENKDRITTDALSLFAPLLTLGVGCYNIYSTGLALNLLPFIYSLLSLAGCGIASLLLWYEVDSSNDVLKEVCGGQDKNGSLNCGAVLNSKGSSFLGISWSLWGFSFFFTLLFGQLINGFSSPETLQYLSLFAIFAALYIPFSIYYQWKVVKQWCKLCLTTQAILLSQFLIVISSNRFNRAFVFSNSNISWHGRGVFAGVGILCFLLTHQILKLLNVVKSDKSKLNESMRIKFDPAVFHSVLKRQKAINRSTEGLGIFLGNPNAKKKIIKVCNPCCNPCARMHSIIDDLLEENEDLSVQIIFTASADDEDERNKPVKHLLAISEVNSEDVTKECLNEWYNAHEKNYERFAEKYKMNRELAKQLEKVEKMRAWCKGMDIKFTPTIFFNGYQLLETYTVPDIDYFLKL